MLKLRFWLGVLAWWLVIFYNIERLNEPINIASFVYILAPFAAGVQMISPRFFSRRSVLYIIVPLLIVYFPLKVLFGYEIFGQALPLTVTEIASLALTVLFTKQIVAIAWDFEDTVSKLTIQQIGLPPRLYETVDTEDLYREVKRSRRFQHELTLFVLKPVFDPQGVSLNRILVDMERTMVDRYVKARLARLLTEVLRDSDMIAQDRDGFVVLLPETGMEEAQKLVESLKVQADSTMSVRLNIGTAHFPDSSLTFTGLLDAAREEAKAQEEQADESDSEPIQAASSPQALAADEKRSEA